MILGKREDSIQALERDTYPEDVKLLDRYLQNQELREAWAGLYELMKESPFMNSDKDGLAPIGWLTVLITLSVETGTLKRIDPTTLEEEENNWHRFRWRETGDALLFYFLASLGNDHGYQNACLQRSFNLATVNAGHRLRYRVPDDEKADAIKVQLPRANKVLNLGEDHVFCLCMWAGEIQYERQDLNPSWTVLKETSDFLINSACTSRMHY